jgi:predicted small lipoprotein YifL
VHKRPVFRYQRSTYFLWTGSCFQKPRAVSLALSACGRKGDIDPPSTPVEMRNKRAADGSEPKPATAERPFILDKLL